MSALETLTKKALAFNAERQAIEWRDHWYTWGQLRRIAERTIELLHASGADPRAPVALLPRNYPASIGAMFGIICENRNIQMIHVYQSPEGIARDIAKLRPAVVVAMASDLTDGVQQVLKDEGIAAIAIDDLELDLLKGLENSTIECTLRDGSPQFELLTSGTTGPPKQFLLSYDMLAEHMVQNNIFGTQDAIDTASIPPVFQYLSFSTITGLYLVLPTLLHGIRITLVDRFNLAAWHKWVVKHRPLMAGLPPPAIQMILEAELPVEDLSSLHYAGTGAAPLDPNLQRAFESRYGIPILLTYGATEFGGPVAQNTFQLRQQWGDAKFNSVGKGFAGAQLRVVDADTGTELPIGAEGVLEVMAPRMGEHWIRTSDQALIDSDGFLFIKGRADGAINRGGFKMLPDDIERVLQLHPSVAAAGVIGIADKRLGQVPGAVIELDPREPAPTVEELEAHLRQHVASTHIPAAWRIVDRLPYTNMMKVDRVALRQLLEPVEAP
jgi:acyl-coenzyme A synthetase/AMP-(fatty) acid ligase